MSAPDRLLRIEPLALDRALAEVAAPILVVGRSGIVSWANAAAARLLGDPVGQKLAQLVAPAVSHRVRSQLAKQLLGTAGVSEARMQVVRPDRSRVLVDLASVPLRAHGRVVGVFVVLQRCDDGVGRLRGNSRAELTPRQHEVLWLLAEGLSTDEIAAELSLATETVRNHVRGLLRALGVHSRLQAVAAGRRRGLL